ncbi:MAG: hypothetical protein WBK55_05040 [Alphaproteobacteria bacterium]
MTLYAPSPSSERHRLHQTFEHVNSGGPVSPEDVKRLISAFSRQKNFNADVLVLVKKLSEKKSEKEQFRAYLHFASSVGLWSQKEEESNDADLSFEEFLENASSLIGKLPGPKRHDAWMEAWGEYAENKNHENPKLAETTSKFLKEIVNSIKFLESEKSYVAAAGLLNNIHEMKDGADRLEIEEQAYAIALKSIAGEEAYDRAVDIFHDLRAYHTLRPRDDKDQFEKSKGKFQDLMQDTLQKAKDAAGQLSGNQRFERLMSIYKKTRRDFRHDDKYIEFRKTVLEDAARALDELPEDQQEKAALRIYEQTNDYAALETSNLRWAAHIRKFVDDKQAALPVSEPFNHERSDESLNLRDVVRFIDLLTAEKNFSTDLFALVKKLPKNEQFKAYVHYVASIGLRPKGLSSTSMAVPFDEFLENVSPLIDMLEIDERHDAWWAAWDEYTKDKNHENLQSADTTTFFLKNILSSIDCLEETKRYNAAVSLLNKIHELTDKGDRLGLEEQVYETALKNIKAEEETYDRAIEIYHDLRAYHTLRPQDDRAAFEHNEIKFQIHMQNALTKAMEAVEQLDPGQRFERLMSIYKKTRRDFSHDDKYNEFRKTVLEKAARVIDLLPENQQQDAAFRIYEQTDHDGALEAGNPRWAANIQKLLSDKWEALKPVLGIDPAPALTG